MKKKKKHLYVQYVEKHGDEKESVPCLSSEEEQIKVCT